MIPSYEDLLKRYPDGCPKDNPTFRVKKSCSLLGDMEFSSRLTISMPDYHPYTDFPIVYFDEEGISPLRNDKLSRMYKIPYSNIDSIKLPA